MAQNAETCVMNRIKSMVTLLRGNNKMYAPNTPEMAPEAPRLGIRRFVPGVLLQRHDLVKQIFHKAGKTINIVYGQEHFQYCLRISISKAYCRNMCDASVHNMEVMSVK
jgi:hypothetical protein